MSTPKIYPVILAGGASSRLWPASGRERPKWDLRLSRTSGGEMQSLLEGAWERARAVAAAGDCLVVSGTAQAERIRQVLPELPPENLLIEPEPRDTAGAVAFSAAAILKKHEQTDRGTGRRGDGEIAPPGTVPASPRPRVPASVPSVPVMLVLPGDHVIAPLAEFARCVEAGAAAALRLDVLITFGIVPRRPATAYGYIHRGAELTDAETRRRGDAEVISAKTVPVSPRPPVSASVGSAPEVYQVHGFREKPDRATAESYLASGEYFWNSGIFIWQVATVLAEFERQLPGHAALVRELCAAKDAAAWDATARRLFPGLVKVSIDYGILEEARNIATIRAAFQWDDIGSWSSVAEHLDKNGGNAVGPETSMILIDARNNVVFAPGKRVALIGVEGLAVVVSDDEILVCRLERDQEVKKAHEEAGKK